MQTEPTRVYWDACVLLSYINESSDRTPVIGQVLEEARQHVCELVTSTLSVVEVAFGAQEQTQSALDDSVLAKIDGLWKPGSVVRLVEFYFAIAQVARGLMRSALAKGWQLKPADAIHLGTAQHLHAGRFHTYDTSLKKYEDLTGLLITEPDALQPQLPGV